MPDGVLLPGVRLQERVLFPGARLRVLPARAEHVLARVDQPLRMLDRVLVDRVDGHACILAEPRSSSGAPSCRTCKSGSGTRISIPTGSGSARTSSAAAPFLTRGH